MHIQPLLDELVSELPEFWQDYAENIKNSIQPIISFTLTETQPKIWDSKIGGVPYLPKDFPYPTNSQGIQMHLLAQFNFAQMPKLTSLPTTGMLQFFVIPDETSGRNYQYQGNAKDGFCVIYHEHIIEDVQQLQLISPPKVDDFFSVKGEYSLTFNIAYQPITSNDLHFYRKIFDVDDHQVEDFMDQVMEQYDIDFYEQIIDSYDDFIRLALNHESHQLLGYPCFTDGDFREHNDRENIEQYQLLLQLDSDKSLFDYRVIWGDCGVAQFFIHPDDLKNRDFSNVMYDWYS